MSPSPLQVVFNQTYSSLYIKEKTYLIPRHYTMNRAPNDPNSQRVLFVKNLWVFLVPKPLCPSLTFAIEICIAITPLPGMICMTCSGNTGQFDKCD